MCRSLYCGLRVQNYALFANPPTFKPCFLAFGMILSLFKGLAAVQTIKKQQYTLR